jgi:hypothetical protein
MPSDVSLAHNGALFLDELPEFRHHALELLRQPLYDSALYRQFREWLLPHCARRHGRTGYASPQPRDNSAHLYHDAFSKGMLGTPHSG